VLDYDLFCRFSRDYVFHTFDQVVANYRLHADSKTQGVDDARRLRDAVTVSRRYWGAGWTPQGAAIRLSWARHQFDRRGRSFRLLVDGLGAWREHRPGAALWRFAAGVLLGPDVALAGAGAPMARRLGGPARRALSRLGSRKTTVHPQTRAWRGFTALHHDGWSGPTLTLDVERPAGDAPLLIIEGDAPMPLAAPLVLTFRLAGTARQEVQVGDPPEFRVSLPLADVPPGTRTLHIEANGSFVPHDLWGNGDYRPLAFRIARVRVEPAAETAASTERPS